MHSIGIDLGGTKTEGILMTRDGATLARRRVATPNARGYEAIVAAVASLVAELEAAAGDHCTVGICTPGSISSRTGLLKNSNTTCLNGRDIKGDIQSVLERRVLIENDANCFALSEAVDGAAEGFDTVFGIIMGTGVGGGIVVNRRLHAGRHHIAGEWGHNVLEHGGPECYCGKRGCVEAFLSGRGLLRDWPDEHTRPAAVPELLDRARAGDRDAQAVLDRYLERFGAALATVVNILDPDALVLGGGLSNIPELYDRGVERLKQHVFNDQFTTPVLRNRHGDSSGVRGAAQLWTTAGSLREEGQDSPFSTSC